MSHVTKRKNEDACRKKNKLVGVRTAVNATTELVEYSQRTCDDIEPKFIMQKSIEWYFTFFDNNTILIN
jgi:hypothetical protein